MIKVLGLQLAIVLVIISMIHIYYNPHIIPFAREYAKKDFIATYDTRSIWENARLMARWHFESPENTYEKVISDPSWKPVALEGDVTITNASGLSHVKSVTFLLNDGTVTEYTDEDWETIRVEVQ